MSDADLPLTIDRADLEQTMMGIKPLAAQIEDGTAKADGDLGVLQQLASTMVTFEMGFEISPGTKGSTANADLNELEAGSLASSAE